MLKFNKVHCQHVLDGLRQLPDESVDMVITSPPYWNLRDYGKLTEIIWDGTPNCKHIFNKKIIKKRSGGEKSSKTGHHQKGIGHFVNSSQCCSKCNAWKGQLGLEPDFHLYINHLLDIFDEVKRVLKKTGTCWVNLGDTYGGSGNASGHKKNTKNAGRTTISYGSTKGNQKLTRSYQKCLLAIPERFILGMIGRGWILRNKIIWHKPNHMPSSVKDRFANSWEYLLLFSKSKKYYFDHDAVRISHSSTTPIQKTFPTTKEISVPFDSITINNELFCTIETIYNSTRNTPLLSSTNIGDKLASTLLTFFNNFNDNGLSESSNISMRFFPIMTTPTKSHKINQNISGIVIAEISQRFNMMNMDFSRFSTFLTFEISPMKNSLSNFSPVPPFPISSTTTPVRISFFSSVDGTPCTIANFTTEIMLKKGRFEFSNRFSAEVTSYNNLSDLTSFFSSPSFHSYMKDKQLFRLCCPTQEGKRSDDIIEDNTNTWEKVLEDYWNIATKPFKEAHFAVFPERLVKRPIMAGCPRYVCKECGTPRLYIKVGGNINAFNIRVRDVKSKKFKHSDRKASKGEINSYQENNYISKIKNKIIFGCNCDAGFKPGIVLDPFIGSGTTGVVAKRLGRNFIGFELNPEYVRIAEKRLRRAWQ